MSDQQSAASDTSVQPTQTPAISAQPEAKPRVMVDELPPEALKRRLEDEGNKVRREMLAELGVTDVSDVKTAMAELNKRRDSEKTETERLREQTAKLEGKAKQAERYGEIIKRRAIGEMASLKPQQIEAVKEIAGDDPAEQLRVIDIMRAKWGTDPLQSEAEVQAAAAGKPKPPPETTAPARGAPPEQQLSETDHKRVYEELKKSNPFAATEYLQRHYTDVFPSQ